MNLLTRARSSTRMILSLSSTGKHLFYRHPITALQECNFYSTKTALSNLKTQQLTKPKILKISESSSSFSQRIKKQGEAPTAVWPKPGEIPYQAKAANFLNLIGNVKIPVQFECDSDGKHFAATVICLGNAGERNHLLIPVVFEGDLAHVVACHVKENDCVFVSGLLSADPLRLVSIESLGKVHVVAENLNFVEGPQKSVLGKNVDEKLDMADDDVNSNQLSIESNAKPLLKADLEAESATLEHGNVELLPEKVSNKSGESVSKKKDADQIWDLWRDLVNNPLQWWDYRKHKTNGLVKGKFPDFKQKGTGEPLWITSAPKWVLPGLGNLECDVKNLKLKQVQGGEKHGDKNQSGKLEDSWKNLVESPNKWWDNRANKKNPKAPDFKHKETGEALWLASSPVWALSKLPPMKGDQNTT